MLRARQSLQFALVQALTDRGVAHSGRGGSADSAPNHSLFLKHEAGDGDCDVPPGPATRAPNESWLLRFTREGRI